MLRGMVYQDTSLGYSLADLLAGVALTLLLLFLGASSYAGLIGDQSLKFEARRLKAVLEQLSIDAVQRESDILVELEERGYTARKGGPNGGQILTHRLKSPVRISAAPRGEWQLTLYASGVSTPSTVVLADGRGECRVVLSLRSRITMRCG